jgi:hypothetical protein
MKARWVVYEAVGQRGYGTGAEDLSSPMFLKPCEEEQVLQRHVRAVPIIV